MTSPVPFPEPPRRILPSPGRRLAFLAIGAAAAAVRLATAPARLLRRTRSPRPVLILEPYGMGDALLLQPLVRAFLSAGRPVTLAARGAWAPLFPAAPDFTFLPIAPDWASPRDGAKYRHPLRDLLRTARALRPHARGAEAIDPRGDARAVLALWLAGAARVRSLPRYWSANDCRLFPGAASTVPLDRRASRRLVSRAFAPAGAPYDRPDVSHLLPPDPPPPSAELPVGLVPLTPWAGKRWPPEHWAVLRGSLNASWIPTLLLCGPGEADEARRAAGADPDAPVREARDPADWVAALRNCRAVVSVNTGPMHLADALDLPLLVLDGSSRLPLWAPEGPRAVVLHHQDVATGAPVHPVGDGLRQQREVMALVTPDEALDALFPLLPAPSQSFTTHPSHT